MLENAIMVPAVPYLGREMGSLVTAAFGLSLADGVSLCRSLRALSQSLRHTLVNHGCLTTCFIVFVLQLLWSAAESSAHLRVEAHSANTAGSMLPLSRRRESKGVMEEGLLHGVHLEDEQIQKKNS